MLRLVDIVLVAIGRRGTRARGRQAYRILVAIVEPRQPQPSGQRRS